MVQQKIFMPLSSSENEGEGGQMAFPAEEPPKAWWSMPRNNVVCVANKKRLSKQLSMRETTREAKWEKRRRQILLQRKRVMEVVLEEGEEEATAARGSVLDHGNGSAAARGRVRSLTDEDLDELRGSIELGFGFSEEGGHNLCNTLPALDLYFAVNRNFSDPKLRGSPSPSSTPTAAATPSSSSNLCSSPGSGESPSSQRSAGSSDSWKILSPGDNPQAVKTRLRHWAQVVACSVKQCC